MTDRRLALILFILVSTIYYMGARSPAGNAASHYMLLRSMADQHQVQIDAYKQFSGGDISLRDGHYYSDKPPGTAIIALPLYEVASMLPGPIARVPGSNRLKDDVRVAWLLMLPALAGAATVVLLYLLLRSYGLSMFSAAASGLVYAFATISWTYGTVLFLHSLSNMIVLSAIILALSIKRAGRLSWPRGLLLGFLMGLSVLVDYSDIIFVLIIMIYLVVSLRRDLVQGDGWWKSIIAFGLGALPSAICLLWYNTVAFGGPLSSSYAYKLNYLPADNPALTFSMPVWKGLMILLVYGSTRYSPVANKGLFLLMPVTLAAIPGAWAYLKRCRDEAWLVLGSFFACLLLFSTHFTPDGGSGDSRYLMPVIALLFVPIGFAIEYLHTATIDRTRRDVLFLLLSGLVFVSATFVLEQFITSDTIASIFDRALKLSTVAKFRLIFDDIFGNWRNTPLLWLAEAVAIGVAYGVTRLRRGIRPQEPAQPAP